MQLQERRHSGEPSRNDILGREDHPRRQKKKEIFKVPVGSVLWRKWEQGQGKECAGIRGDVVLWCWGAMGGQTPDRSNGKGARQAPREGAFPWTEVSEVRLCGWKGVDKRGGGEMRSER